MSTPPEIKLGTRGSRLALAQAHAMADALRQHHPGLVVQVIIIQTTGDKILDTPLSRIGGKGVFTKEIEEHLLAGLIDVAVHSLKDLPTVQPDGLTLGAVTAREDPRDAMISRQAMSVDDLPPGAVVGTSSLRRRAQLAARRPDLILKELRGNVPTRIARMDQGDYDAIILAAAGLGRLGLDHAGIRLVEPAVMLPAPGQGALGLQCRAGDTRTLAALAPLNDAASEACCGAERALLHALGGGCQLPLGTLAEIQPGGLMRLWARVLSLDGTEQVEGETFGPGTDFELIGECLADSMREAGAADLLAGVQAGIAPGGFEMAVARAQSMDALPLGGRRIVVTRAEDADGPLSQAIRDLGGQPLCLPMVSHTAPADPGPLDAELARLQDFQWLVLTSARAVAPLAGRPLPPGLRVAAIGPATAGAAAAAGITVDVMPAEKHDAAGLADAMLQADLRPGDAVFYPRSAAAAPTLVDLLTRAGAMVYAPVAYETRPTVPTDHGAMMAALRALPPDATAFSSPSAVAAFASIVPPLAPGLVASIGPTTSAALRDAGLRVDVEAGTATMESLARAIAEHLAGR